MTRHVVARTMFGDAGLIVNARGDGFVEVAVAGAKKTMLLELRTVAARAWADSASRILRARPRRSNTPRTYRADIDARESSGTMALGRTVTQGVSEYSLFFADDPLGGLTVPIDASEASVFVSTIRRAAAESTKMMQKDTAAATDSAPKPRPKAAPSPARKQPAAQPAATPPSKGAVKPPAKPPADTTAKAPARPAAKAPAESPGY